MAIHRRGAQNKCGVTIRTRKGTPVLAEDDPQNTFGFGGSWDPPTAPTNFTGTGAPGAGKRLILTTLTVSANPSAATVGVKIVFTNGLSVTTSGTSAVIQVPTAIAENTAFGATSATLLNPGAIGGATCPYTIAGTAYIATVVSATAPAPGQVFGVPIDSDPSADLG